MYSPNFEKIKRCLCSVVVTPSVLVSQKKALWGKFLNRGAAHTSSPGGLTLHLRDSWKNCRVRGVTLRLRFLWFGSVRRREQDILRKFSRYYRITVTARLPLLILFVRWSVLLHAVPSRQRIPFHSSLSTKLPKRQKNALTKVPAAVLLSRRLPPQM